MIEYSKKNFVSKDCKIVKYGKQIKTILDNAIKGEDAERFGAAVFDLENGCDFRIKVEELVYIFWTSFASIYQEAYIVEASSVE